MSTLSSHIGGFWSHRFFPWWPPYSQKSSEDAKVQKCQYSYQLASSKFNFYFHRTGMFYVSGVQSLQLGGPAEWGGRGELGHVSGRLSCMFMQLNSPEWWARVHAHAHAAQLPTACASWAACAANQPASPATWFRIGHGLLVGCNLEGRGPLFYHRVYRCLPCFNFCRYRYIRASKYLFPGPSFLLYKC